MYTSESLLNNHLIEVDSLTNRLMNINQTYYNTAHNRLRERLIYENHKVLQRVNEIFSIAKILKERTSDKISFSSLLLEKCRRTIEEINMKTDLFFL